MQRGKCLAMHQAHEHVGASRLSYQMGYLGNLASCI
jgi:hypothetical protein